MGEVDVVACAEFVLRCELEDSEEQLRGERRDGGRLWAWRVSGSGPPYHLLRRCVGDKAKRGGGGEEASPGETVPLGLRSLDVSLFLSGSLSIESFEAELKIHISSPPLATHPSSRSSGRARKRPRQRSPPPAPASSRTGSSSSQAIRHAVQKDLPFPLLLLSRILLSYTGISISPLATSTAAHSPPSRKSTSPLSAPAPSSPPAPPASSPSPDRRRPPTAAL